MATRLTHRGNMLDLCCDQIPRVSLADLKAALVIAGVGY